MTTNAEDGLRKAAKRVLWEVGRIEEEKVAHAVLVLRAVMDDWLKTRAVSQEFRDKYLRAMTPEEWRGYCYGLEQATEILHAQTCYMEGGYDDNRDYLCTNKQRTERN